MIGIILGAVLALAGVLAILFFPFSKRGGFAQRYGRFLALLCMVAGILLVLICIWAA